MKKIISVLLLLSLLLTACGSKEPAETTAAPTTEPTVATTEEVTQPEPTETTEATEPDLGPLHPLTGEPLEGKPVGRPLTLTVNNISAAMPQIGISHADIIHEVETEGGITRLLALFTDYKDVEKIGAVRSARTFFVNLSQAYDAVMAHCGGSAYALNANYDMNGNRVSNWKHIDARSDSAFFRDQARLDSGYAYEHTLFTTGEKIFKSMENHGFDTVLDPAPDFGFRFDPEVKLEGSPAETVEITFLGSKKTTMTYNQDTGLYEAHQYGKDWIDGATGEPLSFRNVVVIKTNQYKPNGYSSFYDLNGCSGEGYLAIGGSIVPIRWQRDNLQDPFTYTFADGTPVTFGTGKTYIAVSANSGDVSYQ